MVTTSPLDPALARGARVFKALGQPTRLFLVQELGRAPRCVRDLQALIGADMSTVSKHLAVLREAGLVRDERRGNQVVYHLAAPCVLEFMDCVARVTGEPVLHDLGGGTHAVAGAGEGRAPGEAGPATGSSR
jgi:ArsR family transcriptional regulator